MTVSGAGMVEHLTRTGYNFRLTGAGMLLAGCRSVTQDAYTVNELGWVDPLFPF